jgi:histone arginine demethylase JMJD6
MSSFIDYLVHNTDDSPLYLFENLNIVSEELRPILDGYQIPPYFAEDIFKLLEDEDRPLFRW